MENKKELERILIVTNHFLPGCKAGGPVKSISNLYDNLIDVYNMFIMTSDRDYADKQAYPGIKKDCLEFYKSFKIYYLSKVNFSNIYKTICEVDPALIYLNSFFSLFSIYIICMKRLGIVKQKIIMAPRGELSSGALSIKAFKKKIFIRVSYLLKLHQNTHFHVTDDTEAKNINKCFVNNQQKTIPNIITNNGNVLQKDLSKNSGQLKIVFISRIAKKKNLLFAIETMQYLSSGDVLFDIYGYIEDDKYYQECKQATSKTKNPVKITYKGSLPPSQVKEVLSNYHLLFFPTLGENFGHVIVEAMQSGCIPLLSDQTPWNDLEQHGAGWSFPLNDRNKFIKAIETCLNFNDTDMMKMKTSLKRYLEARFNIEENKKEYINWFGAVINA